MVLAHDSVNKCTYSRGTMDDDNLFPEQNQEDVDSTTQAIITDALIKQAAALAANGMSQNKISLTLNISRRQVRNIYNDDRFKALVEDIGDDVIRSAKVHIRNEIAGLKKEIIRVLQANLKKDSLDAVKVALKALGAEGFEEQQQEANTGLTVVLANNSDPTKTIEVKPNAPKKIGDLN